MKQIKIIRCEQNTSNFRELESLFQSKWADFTFDHMPLAATLPIFSKFKNDIKSAEAAILNYLLGKVGGEDIVLDKFTVVSAPKKAYVIKVAPNKKYVYAYIRDRQLKVPVLVPKKLARKLVGKTILIEAIEDVSGISYRYRRT